MVLTDIISVCNKKEVSFLIKKAKNYVKREQPGLIQCSKISHFQDRQILKIRDTAVFLTWRPGEQKVSKS